MQAISSCFCGESSSLVCETCFSPTCYECARLSCSKCTCHACGVATNGKPFSDTFCSTKCQWVVKGASNNGGRHSLGSSLPCASCDFIIGKKRADDYSTVGFLVFTNAALRVTVKYTENVLGLSLQETNTVFTSWLKECFIQEYVSTATVPAGSICPEVYSMGLIIAKDIGGNGCAGWLQMRACKLSFKDWIRSVWINETLPEVEKIHRICDQFSIVLEKLYELHSLGVFHNDLHLENIMQAQVSGQGDQWRIIDFGLSKLIETAAQVLLSRILTIDQWNNNYLNAVSRMNDASRGSYNTLHLHTLLQERTHIQKVIKYSGLVREVPSITKGVLLNGMCTHHLQSLQCELLSWKEGPEKLLEDVNFLESVVAGFWSHLDSSDQERFSEPLPEFAEELHQRTVTYLARPGIGILYGQ